MQEYRVVFKWNGRDDKPVDVACIKDEHGNFVYPKMFAFLDRTYAEMTVVDPAQILEVKAG